ncbi:CAAX prenyl protease 1 like protein [Aduncisulcus paluster]|uniref:Ste24 endopeptidase n=1 Tax=Aduncisulcus paluster TaxID=2918883 RepID=A0ABQ5KWW1_9EUKA|nr:CAAX prenyl protease 1 like protein [Aduncisulcus paluster]
MLEEIPFSFEHISIALLLFDLTLDVFLCFRQRRRMNTHFRVPKLLSLFIKEKEYSDNLEYSKDRMSFKLFQLLTVSFVKIFTLKRSLVFSYDIATSILSLKNLSPDDIILSRKYRYVRVILWDLIGDVINLVITIPLSIYSTFHIEKKHGFNKTTPMTFVTDIFKELIVGLILQTPIVLFLLWVMESFSPAMIFVVSTIFIAVFIIISQGLYMYIIAPLFNKFENIESGEYYDAIVKLAEKTEINIKQIRKMDASRRSTHANAYVIGFGNTKRIVLYDTLIQQLNPEGVCAVLAHEIGHVKHHHSIKNIILAIFSASFIIGLFVLFVNTQKVYDDMGFGYTMVGREVLNLREWIRRKGILFTNDEEMPLYNVYGINDNPIFLSFSVFSLILTPVTLLTHLLTRYLSRRFERQADTYAVSEPLNYDLMSTLCIISMNSKVFLDDDWLYSLFKHSHPNLLERMESVGCTKINVEAVINKEKEKKKSEEEEKKQKSEEEEEKKEEVGDDC